MPKPPTTELHSTIPFVIRAHERAVLAAARLGSTPERAQRIVDQVNALERCLNDNGIVAVEVEGGVYEYRYVGKPAQGVN